MVMVLSLVTTAFAAEGDSPKIVTSVDKDSVKPGETITVTYTLSEQLSPVNNITIALKYDKSAFEYKSVDYTNSVFFKAPTTENMKAYSVFSMLEWGDDGSGEGIIVPAGELCKVTLVALENITEAQEVLLYNDDETGETSMDSCLWIDWEEYDTTNGGFDHGKSNPFRVTIAPDGAGPVATATGYSVSMGADQQVAAGQQVRIPVTVASSKGIAGFNAYDMTFTYDPAALTLNTKTDDAANLTVKDDNGTVRVRRYGATQALGEALALDFTAKKAASSTVTLTKAKFDIDANSINFDAPDATITDAETTVKGLWKVTLPDGFLSTAANGSMLVEDGQNFTFRATDTHYEYVLKINGVLVEMKTAEYTIKNVTANQNVELVAKTGKTYTIKFAVVDNTTTENQATVADLVEYTGTTVQYPNDYKFTVKFPGTGYVVRASVAPRQNTWDYVRREDGAKLYTLSGASLVGDDNNEITITLAKSKNNSLHNIVVTGSGADAFSESNALTFYSDENYTFALNKSDYYDYTIAVWYEERAKFVPMEYKNNGDGTYTIIDMPTYDVNISITKTARAIDPSTVEVLKYLELNNKTVFLVRVQGSLSAYNNIDKTTSYIGFTYDGQRMYVPFYQSSGTAYQAVNGMSYSVYLVILNKDETLTKEDAVAKLGIVTSTEQENKDQTLKVGSDVNEDEYNRRDVNDVQLIYDLYNRRYDSFETVNMRKFLKADVNGDCALNSQDAVKLAGELLAD